MRDLNGTVAWITGAGSGIGEAAALALAKAGASVALSGRREELLRRTAEAIAKSGGDAMVEPLDVTDRSAAEDVAEAIDRRFERLDILVNNAGINVAQRHWDAPDLASWDDVMRVNVTGVYNVAAAALPVMRRYRDGLIVNIASWAGRYHGYFAGAAYSASKHAVVSLNASINIEESKNGIRACAICPGEVATPILDLRPDPPGEEARALMLQPEDLAETVLYVARMPARACVNEILISPTWNRSYRAMTVEPR